MRWGMRVPTILMGLLFLVSVALQYNDPDPARWMAIYGAAALTCLLALRGRLPRWLPALVGLAALVWAATLAPRVVGQVAPGDLFREMGMATLAVEEAREMGGLLVVAVWMLVLLTAAPRQVRPS
jgi:hypothetical protein